MCINDELFFFLFKFDGFEFFRLFAKFIKATNVEFKIIIIIIILANRIDFRKSIDLILTG